MNKILEGTQGGFVSKARSIVTSPRFIISLAAVLAVGTLGAWQYHNMTSADRTFWGMVDSNLKTTSYTRHTYQKSGAQGVDQVFQTATSPQNIVFSRTVFSQTGVDSVKAVTENIGTPTADYVRYTSIETAKKQDFSSVIGVWGTTQESGVKETRGQIFNQAVLGVVPIGNLNAAQRRELVDAMKKNSAYEYKIIDTKKHLFNLRPTHTMQVTVSPVGYVTALKQFAGTIGLNHLKDVDPSEYKDAQKLSFMVSVDGWTHQMTQINQGNGGKTEIVSGKNMKKNLPKAPDSKNTISVDELESKLQLVQ